jgi:hypothetical protein
MMIMMMDAVELLALGRSWGTCRRCGIAVITIIVMADAFMVRNMVFPICICLCRVSVRERLEIAAIHVEQGS